MAGKNIVPQNSNEGQLGTDAKRWAEGHFQTVLQLGGKNVTVPFVVTIPKTSAYTAAPNDYALVDLSAGNVTITLPAAPQDGTIIGVKIIATANDNICTILAGGLNVFTKIAGVTTKILKLLEEAAIVQYRAQSNLWIIVSNDLPLEALDYRYDTVALRNTAIAALANVARTGSYTDLTNKPIGGGSLVAVPADYNSASTPPCMALDLAGGFIYASTIANVWQRGSIVFGTFGAGGTQLNYVSDGDTNGLFFYLGQTHGSGIWGNPQTNGGLNISLSAGLIMGAGSLLALTDRAFNDNYTSAATATQGYIFTLPTGKSLTLNKWSYQIRNNAYAHIPLRLQIAGSNDGSTWTTLDDKALSSTAPASTWFTFTPASLNSTSYRYFMLTMPNNNDQNSGLITIGEFELYGVFH